jgi:hypothetical protein
MHKRAKQRVVSAFLCVGRFLALLSKTRRGLRPKIFGSYLCAARTRNDNPRAASVSHNAKAKTRRLFSGEKNDRLAKLIIFNNNRGFAKSRKECV